MASRDLPPGLAGAQPWSPPRLWVQVSASVYDDSVALRLSCLRHPGGRVENLLQERYSRSSSDTAPADVAPQALSWWVDQLDLAGGWSKL